MSYTKKTWTTGDTILASDLNHIEQGIYDADAAASAASTAAGAAEAAQAAAENAETAAVAAQSSAGQSAASASAAQTAATTAKNDAQAARADAITAKTDAQTAKTLAETAQSAAESAASTAQTAATNAQNAAAAAQAIGVDAQTVASLVDSPTIKKSDSGSKILRVDDASTLHTATATGVTATRVYGKNLANPSLAVGTSGPNSASYDSATGAVTIEGTTAGISNFQISAANDVYLPAGTYYASTGNANKKGTLRLTNNAGGTAVYIDTANEGKVDIEEAGTFTIVLRITSEDGVQDAEVYYPQLEYGERKTPYETYTMSSGTTSVTLTPATNSMTVISTGGNASLNYYADVQASIDDAVSKADMLSAIGLYINDDGYICQKID